MDRNQELCCKGYKKYQACHCNRIHIDYIDHQNTSEYCVYVRKDTVPLSHISHSIRILQKSINDFLDLNFYFSFVKVKSLKYLSFDRNCYLLFVNKTHLIKHNF